MNYYVVIFTHKKLIALNIYINYRLHSYIIKINVRRSEKSSEFIFLQDNEIYWCILKNIKILCKRIYIFNNVVIIRVFYKNTINKTSK